MAFFYSLFYLLFCGIVVYPPSVFVSAGLTITQLLSSLLGSENENFIEYHVRRSVATAIAHSCLPLGYLLGLHLSNDGETDTLLWKLGWTVVSMIPVAVMLKVLEWSRDNWLYHPLVKNLLNFTNADLTWMTLAAQINAEYKSVEKITINVSSVKPSIVTDNWIIKVDFYTLYIARQSDAVMIVKESDTHYISPNANGEQQFINIEVKPMSNDIKFPTFYIRLNSLDFKDLESKVTRPIVVLPHIVFHKTVIEKFIDVFKEQTQLNQKYISNRELEMCIGCMQVLANVKIFKRCTDVAAEGMEASPNCEICRCRPMWCVECMARWFGTRQDPDRPESWLGNKCTCPLCRQIFCILDVCYVELSF